MDDLVYWIWLSLLFHYGSNKPCQILSVCDSPKDFYALSEEEMRLFGFLSQKEIEAAKKCKLEKAEEILEDCKRAKISILTYNDPDYPERLKLIFGPPIVLYYLGNIKGLDEEAVITVVGTRRATNYSSYVTKRLASEMAEAGAVIVSGCAIGIDSCAHIGALHGNGRTIGVLGCGLAVNYPTQSRDVKIRILKHGGALITELPPRERPSRTTFPVRNRILAGLALGVVVTHAPEKSGALITAELALEQGKDVFCVPPCNIYDRCYSGVIRYLRDGAIPVFSASDVLGFYSGAYANRIDASKLYDRESSKKDLPEKEDTQPKEIPEKAVNQTAEKEKKQNEIREEQKKKYQKMIESFDEKHLLVYNNLEFTPKSADELLEITRLSVNELLSILTEMEIFGLITSFSGKRFALCEK